MEVKPKYFIPCINCRKAWVMFCIKYFTMLPDFRSEWDKKLLVETETLWILVLTLRLTLILFISSLKSRYWDPYLNLDIWSQRLRLRLKLVKSQILEKWNNYKNYTLIDFANAVLSIETKTKTFGLWTQTVKLVLRLLFCGLKFETDLSFQWNGLASSPRLIPSKS